MPLPSKEPKVQLRDLLKDNMNISGLSQTFKQAWIHTGQFDEESENPQVTITGVSDLTDPNAIASDGSGLVSWADNTADINAWVPYDHDIYSSSGAAKDFAYELIAEVYRVIEQNQRGEGTTDLTRIAPNQGPTDGEEVGRDPPPFSKLLQISYGYRTEPE